MTRLLAIDLGDRRIGIAVADTTVGLARPLTTIRRGRTLDEDVAAIGRLVAEQRTEELVVGLPIEASGIEGPMAAAARDWATAVGDRIGRPVVMRDERLSSHVAEGRVGPAKRGRSGGPPSRAQRDAYRARIDREAAAVILQDELEARASAVARSPVEPTPEVPR